MRLLVFVRCSFGAAADVLALGCERTNRKSDRYMMVGVFVGCYALLAKPLRENHCRDQSTLLGVSCRMTCCAHMYPGVPAIEPHGYAPAPQYEMAGQSPKV
jgi:hypothetical protein